MRKVDVIVDVVDVKAIVNRFRCRSVVHVDLYLTGACILNMLLVGVAR